jgi:phosphate transport system permease protein
MPSLASHARSAAPAEASLSEIVVGEARLADRAPAPSRPLLTARTGRQLKERAITAVLFTCAAASTLVTVGVVFVLLRETIGFFAEVSIVEFLTGTRWEPMFREQHFGVLPLLSGSFMIAAGAGLIALPLGLMSAIFLSEYAGPRLRRTLKPVLEILAGVPTVVYGYFALTFITPLLRVFLPETEIFNALSASFVVGVMIIPTVASLSEDALQAVPDSLREGAYGLGATKLEVSTRVVVPSALSGIIASFILGISRAVGETMAVTIAAGNLPNLTLNPLESMQTMTAYIVQASLGDTPQGTIVYQTLFAVGMTLFVVTLAMNVLSQWVLARFREEYQ